MNLDRWFLKQVEVSIRKGPRGDKTAGCLDETFLKSYAEEAAKFSLADDRVEHVASCSYCMSCLLELRATQQAKSAWGLRYIAVACLGLAARATRRSLAFALHRWRPAVAPVQSCEFRRTLDLSRQVAIEAALRLPAALVSVELGLPQESRPGVYDVTVLTSGNRGNRVAHAEGKSTGTEARAMVTVPLDLRNAAPGRYVLSTQCEGESAPQLYPLEIGQPEGR